MNTLGVLPPCESTLNTRELEGHDVRYNILTLTVNKRQRLCSPVAPSSHEVGVLYLTGHTYWQRELLVITPFYHNLHTPPNRRGNQLSKIDDFNGFECEYQLFSSIPTEELRCEPGDDDIGFRPSAHIRNYVLRFHLSINNEGYP